MHKIVPTNTTYYVRLKCRPDTVHVYKSNEVEDHYSLYDGIEPCSGVLRHYGTKAELIAELKEYIEILEQI